MLCISAIFYDLALGHTPRFSTKSDKLCCRVCPGKPTYKLAGRQ